MYDWDERKRRANIAKHRVDFALVVEIFEGDYVEAKDPRGTREEARYLAVGTARGRNYVVAFTWRGEVRRIISAWTVGEKGKRRYQSLLLGGYRRNGSAR